MMDDIKMGDVRDFRNFMGAVIDEKSFDKIGDYIDEARKTRHDHRRRHRSEDAATSSSPRWCRRGSRLPLMCEEIFGPVVTVYVYPDDQWEETLRIVDRTSPYALTGAVFADDRHAVRQAPTHLRNAAGNFYINDKPHGRGGRPAALRRRARLGHERQGRLKLNLMRWVSARTIKETFAPPTDYRYPFMAEE